MGIGDHWTSRRRRVHIGMTSRVKHQAPHLLVVVKAHPHVCKAILHRADRDLLQCLSECALNILKGSVKLKPRDKARLSKYRQKLWKVAAKRVSLKQKHTNGRFRRCSSGSITGTTNCTTCHARCGGNSSKSCRWVDARSAARNLSHG